MPEMVKTQGGRCVWAVETADERRSVVEKAERLLNQPEVQGADAYRVIFSLLSERLRTQPLTKVLIRYGPVRVPFWINRLFQDPLI